MTSYKERYSFSTQLQAIAAAATDTFGNKATERDIQRQRDKWGSMNRMIVTSRAEENLEIRLDGLDTRLIAVITGLGGAAVIAPEDGIFFDWVEITNVSAVTTANDEINVLVARADPIPGT